MSDITSSSFVRQDLLDERPAPVKTTGFVGLVRTRLFNSPTNILLTIVGALLLWFTIIPSVKFLMVDAVWTGKDRTACLAENAGFAVGACWPYIQAKLPQLIYGFYPEAERWRVDLTLVLSVVLLVPLLIPRLPSKALNAGLFFFAFPVVAFFLLHGGGIKGFGLSWTADLLQLFDDSIIGAGKALLDLGKASSAAPLLWVVGNVIVLVGTAIYWLIFPLTWLRDQLQGTGQSVWTDFSITAAVVSVIAFVLGGGLRTGGRALTSSIVTFVAIAIVIKLMGLDHGGLPIVQTNLWGGLLVTLVVSVTGIVTSLPIGIALALGRRSTIPLIRIFSIAFIEFWRGVPLITVLFFATYMLPLFLPGNFTVDGLMRALIGIALFTGAYQAENVRGGLAAIPRTESAEWQVLAELPGEGFTIEKGTFEAVPGLVVPAHVYRPSGAGPHPGVVHSLGHWMENARLEPDIQRYNARTLTAGLTFFQGRFQSNEPLVMTGALIATLPMLALYIIGQRFFIRGLSTGFGK